MESYVVIGLGRFGTELATRLYDCGEEVMVIDTNEGLVDKIADRVTRAVAADARDVDVLRKLGAGNFDRAIVAVGTDLGASALITMNLKRLRTRPTEKYWRSWVQTRLSSRSGKWRTNLPWDSPTRASWNTLN